MSETPVNEQNVAATSPQQHAGDVKCLAHDNPRGFHLPMDNDGLIWEGICLYCEKRVGYEDDLNEWTLLYDDTSIEAQ